MSERLLVVYAEDDASDADLTRLRFADLAPDIELEIVPTGRACLERLQAGRPDLLLLDHRLPDMQGLDVLRRVVKGAAVPVVMVTGVGDEKLAVKALRLGAFSYVPKAGNYLETLPELARAVVARARQAERERPPGDPRCRILYVEHEPADAELTLQHFANEAPRFEVEVVGNSSEALARLAAAPPLDAALVDLRGLDIGGLEFVREALRQNLGLPPFVIVTGQGDEAAAVASLKLGAADYVLKREGYLDHLVYVIERAVAHARMASLNERLRFELDERRKAEQALREADRRKSEYLGLLSHELRNPLAPICNSLYVLERAQPGGEQARRAVAVIGRQVAHLSRLVDDLLDVTRIGKGKVQLHLARIELGGLVARTVEDHRPVFAERGITLETRIQAERLSVKGDATRLMQLLGNLLQNAVKFTAPGGQTTVSLIADDRRQQAVLRVRDTGVGIAKELLPHLFEPFMQADHTLDRSRGGLGLGLAMVKGFVELHGGEVSAHSDGLGRGAEFVLRLPLEPEISSTTAGARLESVPAARPRRVLVVEDNVDAATTLQEALALEGHAVEVAYSGGEGLQKLARFRPDVVLCDIGLPDSSGYEVARSVRARPDLEPVMLVAVTGYARPEDVARAKDAGFDQHLAKPPDLETLRDLLASVQVRS